MFVHVPVQPVLEDGSCVSHAIRHIRLIFQTATSARARAAPAMRLLLTGLAWLALPGAARVADSLDCVPTCYRRELTVDPVQTQSLRT
jgi:hypothetical protein